jgi:hypothetical protein
MLAFLFLLFFFFFFFFFFLVVVVSILLIHTNIQRLIRRWYLLICRWASSSLNANHLLRYVLAKHPLQPASLHSHNAYNIPAHMFIKALMIINRNLTQVSVKRMTHAPGSCLFVNSCFLHLGYLLLSFSLLSFLPINVFSQALCAVIRSKKGYASTLIRTL